MNGASAQVETGQQAAAEKENRDDAREKGQAERRACSRRGSWGGVDRDRGGGGLVGRAGRLGGPRRHRPGGPGGGTGPPRPCAARPPATARRAGAPPPGG